VNQLCFGDNLNVLREHLAEESVDLIYLGKPFNSKRDYNLQFKPCVASGLRPDGRATGSTLHSQAQITAFGDSWHWGEQAERDFDELTRDITGLYYNGSTQLLLRLATVRNAGSYLVQLSTDGGMTWVEAVISRKANWIVLANLTPTKTYIVQARASGGSTGSSAWAVSSSIVCT
jgi:hypothetical protein